MKANYFEKNGGPAHLCMVTTHIDFVLSNASVEGRYNQDGANWNNSSTEGGGIRSSRAGSVLQVDHASPGVPLLLVKAMSPL